MLVAILWLVFNPTFRTAVSNLFQNVVRFFASWVVETDPIGILRNNLDDMKKAKYNLDQTLQRFAGSDERLAAQHRRQVRRDQQSGPQGHEGPADGRRRHRSDGEGAALDWKARPSWSRPEC